MGRPPGHECDPELRRRHSNERDDPVEVVWHDHVLIQVRAGKMVSNFAPRRLRDASDVVQPYDAILDITKQTRSVTGADRNKKGAGRCVVVSRQSSGTPMEVPVIVSCHPVHDAAMPSRHRHWTGRGDACVAHRRDRSRRDVASCRRHRSSRATMPPTRRATVIGPVGATYASPSGIDRIDGGVAMPGIARRVLVVAPRCRRPVTQRSLDR